MKTKEILEKLEGTTGYEGMIISATWAFQLAKDLRIAVEALKTIKDYQEFNEKVFKLDTVWRMADRALNKLA